MLRKRSEEECDVVVMKIPRDGDCIVQVSEVADEIEVTGKKLKLEQQRHTDCEYAPEIKEQEHGEHTGMACEGPGSIVLRQAKATVS